MGRTVVRTKALSVTAERRATSPKGGEARILGSPPGELAPPKAVTERANTAPALWLKNFLKKFEKRC